MITPFLAQNRLGSCGTARLQGGQRVRITVRDQYYGWYGTLVDRRGTTFWHILMDAVDGRVAHIIYKKDSSLEVVNDN